MTTSASNVQQAYMHGVQPPLHLPASLPYLHSTQQGHS